MASIIYLGASLVAQRIKRLPAMRETRVQSLGREDPLEKEMATHSSVLAWRIPGMEEPGELLSLKLHRVGHDCSDLAAVAAAHIFFCSSKDPIVFGQMTSQPEVNIILIFFPK